jgi:hypothetical protein
MTIGLDKFLEFIFSEITRKYFPDTVMLASKGLVTLNFLNQYQGWDLLSIEIAC